MYEVKLFTGMHLDRLVSEVNSFFLRMKDKKGFVVISCIPIAVPHQSGGSPDYKIIVCYTEGGVAVNTSC